MLAGLLRLCNALDKYDDNYICLDKHGENAVEIVLRLIAAICENSSVQFNSVQFSILHLNSHVHGHKDKFDPGRINSLDRGASEYKKDNS